jgi:hypothetical protein
LVEQRPDAPVISVFVDLDPERFATAPARATQIRSLLDEARREVEHEEGLSHDELVGLRADIERLEDYLLSREPPYEGSRALAVYCCGREELFEVVPMTRPVEGRVVVERTPYVEPLVRGANEERWCVALVNRRLGRILAGPADRLQEIRALSEDTHGQHDQGGWSQARYERSVEKETDDHLRHVAEVLYRRWRRERFQRLVLGGPTEIVPRLEGMLHEELRSRLIEGRLEVDVESANEPQIEEALTPVVEEDARVRERQALDQMSAGVGAGGRGAGGAADVLAALNERRVGTLLLEEGFDGRGSRCATCRMLTLEAGDACPADGSELVEVEHLREAVVEAALEQGAEVLVVRRYADLGRFGGIGAVLRF